MIFSLVQLLPAGAAALDRHSIWWLFFFSCLSPCRPLVQPRYLASSGSKTRFPTRSIADGVFFPCRLPQTVGFTVSLNSTAPRFPVEKLSGGGEGGRHVFPRPAILRSNNQRAIIRTTGRTSSFHLPILSGDCGFTLAPGRGLSAFQTQSGGTGTGTGTMEVVTSFPSRAQHRSSVDASWSGGWWEDATQPSR